MNTYSVSRLALALAFGVTLSACSSTPADQQPLNADCTGHYRASHTQRRRSEKLHAGGLFPVAGSQRRRLDAVCHQPAGAA